MTSCFSDIRHCCIYVSNEEKFTIVSLIFRQKSTQNCDVRTFSKHLETRNVSCRSEVCMK
jgi:hypothetical protein